MESCHIQIKLYIKLEEMSSRSAQQQSPASSEGSPSSSSTTSSVRDIPTKYLVRLCELQELRSAVIRDQSQACKTQLSDMAAEIDRRRRDLAFDPADLIDGEISGLPLNIPAYRRAGTICHRKDGCPNH